MAAPWMLGLVLSGVLTPAVARAAEPNTTRFFDATDAEPARPGDRRREAR